MPRLPSFLHQYPGLELELSSSDRLVDLIREGFDCVVRVGTLKDSGLIARPLGKLTQINCVSFPAGAQSALNLSACPRAYRTVEHLADQSTDGRC